MYFEDTAKITPNRDQYNLVQLILNSFWSFFTAFFDLGPRVSHKKLKISIWVASILDDTCILPKSSNLLQILQMQTNSTTTHTSSPSLHSRENMSI